MGNDHIDAKACRDLWGAVLLAMIEDATRPARTTNAKLLQKQADSWLRYSRELLIVANLAGFEGQAIRERYLAGKLNTDFTKPGPKQRKAA